ncbi:MAG: hypothetical protein AAFN18_18350 [Cyanobacteria bacterium J06554_6]
MTFHTRFTQPTSDDDRQACQVCEKYVWTQAELAQFRIAQGDAMARQGDVAGAIAKYTEAQSLDKSLTFDPQARAQQGTTWR